ncbi:hypothetical protein D3C86_1129140 [compost metagenome]
MVFEQHSFVEMKHDDSADDHRSASVFMVFQRIVVHYLTFKRNRAFFYPWRLDFDRRQGRKPGQFEFVYVGMYRLCRGIHGFYDFFGNHVYDKLPSRQGIVQGVFFMLVAVCRREHDMRRIVANDVKERERGKVGYAFLAYG